MLVLPLGFADRDRRESPRTLATTLSAVESIMVVIPPPSDPPRDPPHSAVPNPASRQSVVRGTGSLM